MVYPAPLRVGDTVALVAPSGPCDPARLDAGVRVLKSLGLHCRVTESCHARQGFLAGDDALRARNLHESFADPRIKAVLAARGGYGAQRLLPLLDFPLIARNPKIFAGYSDATALHIAFNTRCRLVTFHAPMPAIDFGGDTVDAETLASFRAALFSTDTRPTHAIVGGNLTLVAASLGTPYEICTRNAFLFLEEINEEPYRIDRLLMQLKLAGKLNDAAGFLFGSFAPHSPQDLAQTFDDIIKPLGKPVITGLSSGHCTPNLTIQLGY